MDFPRFLRDVAQANGLRWTEPHVYYNEFENEFVLEWFGDVRHLSLFITTDGLEYLQSWGTQTGEMEDGSVRDTENFLKLWRWYIDT